MFSLWQPHPGTPRAYTPTLPLPKPPLRTSATLAKDPLFRLSWQCTVHIHGTCMHDSTALPGAFHTDPFVPTIIMSYGAGSSVLYMVMNRTHCDTRYFFFILSRYLAPERLFMLDPNVLMDTRRGHEAGTRREDTRQGHDARTRGKDTTRGHELLNIQPRLTLILMPITP